MLDYSINQQRKWVFLVAQELKNFLEMQETQVQSLGWEDPLEEEMQSAPVFLPGESHGQRSLAGYRTWDCKTMQLSMNAY